MRLWSSLCVLAGDCSRTGTRGAERPEMILIVALLFPVQEKLVVCGLCGTPYDDDECPTCKTEREDPKALIERKLREYWGEKGSVIKDMEEWLEKRGE